MLRRALSLPPRVLPLRWVLFSGLNCDSGAFRSSSYFTCSTTPIFSSARKYSSTNSRGTGPYSAETASRISCALAIPIGKIQHFIGVFLAASPPSLVVQQFRRRHSWRFRMILKVVITQTPPVVLWSFPRSETLANRRRFSGLRWRQRARLLNKKIPDIVLRISAERRLGLSIRAHRRLLQWRLRRSDGGACIRMLPGQP